jgi:hypothetical protein
MGVLFLLVVANVVLIIFQARKKNNKSAYAFSTPKVVNNPISQTPNETPPSYEAIQKSKEAPQKQAYSVV